MKALLRHKIHVAPGAHRRSPGDVRQGFDSGWSGARVLAAYLEALPEEMLRWWAEQERGHILLTAETAGYVFAAVTHGAGSLEAVAQVPLWLLHRRPAEAIARALFPVDHLLGCRGDPGGLWLSDGGGIGERWREVGAQVRRLFALGYGLTEAGRADPHFYLAEGIAAALHDRRRLNTADPKLERLLRNTLLSSGCWRRAFPRHRGR